MAKPRSPESIARKRAATKKWIAANIERKRAQNREYARRNMHKSRERQRRLYQTDPTYRENKRLYRLLVRGAAMGWSAADFERAWTEQSGRCAICGVELLPTGLKKNAVARDHDHKTGKRRDLLCRAHNTAIGLFSDSPDLLRRAADYIDRHAGQERKVAS